MAQDGYFLGRLVSQIRVSGRWDAITLVARDVLDLQEAQRHLPFLSGKAGTAFCIPPPHPSTTNKPPSARERMEFDGSLVLNAILVVAERFSALKRARFGSETDAAAVRGMRVVLCLGDDNGWGRSVGRVLAQGGSSADDGVWVLQGNGDLFLVGENSVEALVKLCLSDPTYQRFTYLGADNGLQRDETAHTGDECALAYVSAAAAVACTSPPIKHGHICGNTEIPSSSMHHADAPTSSLVEIVRGVFRVLNKLDERAADKGCTVAGVAQALARMACRMFYLAEILGGGGHRSGPGEHADWQAQMRGLDTLRLSPDSAWAPPTSVPTVIYGLKRLRNAWLGHDLAVNDITGGGFEECLTGNVRCLPDPHLLVRCARHYERAAAVVVSAAVATASLFVEPPPLAWLGEDKTVSPDGQAAEYGEQEGEHGALPVGASVTSTAPARIDFAGGWTDTPPISYEAGGSVLNAAVTVSGERPVDARCDRIENRRVELVCEGMDGVVTHTVVCSELEDFSDFCVPQAPAALLKAAIICTGIVTLPQASAAASHPPPPSTQASTVALGSLEEQLCRVFGRGGIRVTSRSRLPQGSGMGTSSILAGVVLSSVCVAAGRAMSRTSLVHAVLHVEQLMTAGGGHQDQVGGLLGGVKITRSAATLPLQVCPEPVLLDPIFEEALNQRLVLVFSGKQRLARDLLQGVVRGWHDRLPATVATVKGLVQNAEEAADACQGEGNLEKLGSCLSTYWEQKKRMAPGAEPPQVKSLLDKLRPLSHGLSVCGAGGGGFVVCITKAPGEEGMAQVAAALAATGSSNEVSSMTLHRGSLDPVGMKVLVDNPTASRASWKPPR